MATKCFQIPSSQSVKILNEQPRRVRFHESTAKLPSQKWLNVTLKTGNIFIETKSSVQSFLVIRLRKNYYKAGKYEMNLVSA